MPRTGFVLPVGGIRIRTAISIAHFFQKGNGPGNIDCGDKIWYPNNKSFPRTGKGDFWGLQESHGIPEGTKHEYFRRILCELIGDWVENGEYPADYEVLEKIVKGISYHNAVRYFGFEKQLR